MRVRKIRLVILDCDGVILNSNRAYEQLYEKLFAKYGINVKPKYIYSHFGDSPKHILKFFFPESKIPAIFADYRKQLNDREFRKKIKINKGAKASVAKLSKKYAVVVASGALRSRLLWSLGKFGLMRYFRFVMGSDQVRNAKPHPEMLLKILKRLRAKRNEVIFVGDAPNDLLASRRAKITFVAVLSGVLDRKTARKMKADYIVSDITRVGKLLKEITSRRENF